MSTNKQALKENALAATAGSWVRESGEGWEAICCDDDQGNAGFIIAEFQGKDAAANRKFVESANPATVLALLDELESAQIYAKDRDEENQDLMLTVGRLRVEREASEAELGNALCELLPSVQYMDPPDGGSVKPLEQVRRMVADYREQIQAAEERFAQLIHIISMHTVELGFGEKPITMAELIIAREGSGSDVLAAIRAVGISVKGE
ncbi:ead/Ea22-like family protein [Enterobacter sp. 638]|uniref:Ead/Ea22-like family protein n=1 Tax=Enterobacter sp. (strain 638) TaxID=399742 RepID=A0A9J9KZF5_ENT38|nr:ead/Ea22-like family protein [Enterobacter sp. 638]ABP59700.1 hypothetical protein Ent638_1017 [Enterobacter sp. 638]